MGLRVKILPSHKSRSSSGVLNMGYIHFLVVSGLWLLLQHAGGLDWTWTGCRAWPWPFQVLIPSPHFIINSCVTLGDAGLISGSRRSPGGGHGNPLQYSHLMNPMDREAQQTTVHGLQKSQTRLSNYHFRPLLSNISVFKTLVDLHLNCSGMGYRLVTDITSLWVV